MWYSFGNKKRVSKKKVSSKQQFKITKTLNNFLERNRKTSLKQLNKKVIVCFDKVIEILFGIFLNG